MKLYMILIFVILAGCGTQQGRTGILPTIADGAWWVMKTAARGSAIAQNNPYNSSPITTSGPNIGINAYGLDIHSNRFAQPIVLRPDWGYIPGERLRIKEDAYGLGIHADQYGRPVREYSWP